MQDEPVIRDWALHSTVPPWAAPDVVTGLKGLGSAWHCATLGCPDVTGLCLGSLYAQHSPWLHTRCLFSIQSSVYFLSSLFVGFNLCVSQPSVTVINTCDMPPYGEEKAFFGSQF